MESQKIKITALKNNTGQIDGLPKNPRTLRDERFLALKKSLSDDPEMLELREVIAYDNNGELVVICGNMRLRALKELGVKEIPVKILPKETSIEKLKAYTIKDNVPFGENDWDALGNDWEAEQLTDWGLEIPGWKEEEAKAEEDNYEIPENLQVDVVLGDLIEFFCEDGRVHRLLCGDSTDSDAVAKLMNGRKADMVFTDPPYNIGFEGSMSNKMVNGKKAPADSANQRHDLIKNDKMSEEEFYNFICDVLKEIKIHCNGAYYICFGSQTLNQLLQPLLDLDIQYKSIIIWIKNQAIFSGKDFKSRYEPIVYGRFNDFFNGKRFNEEDIWEFARTQKNDLHPTMKPIPLIENALNYSSLEGMNVLDLFLGSGSTMVASHQLKRKCYGMELDPKYCQVIIDRMTKLDDTIQVKINGKEYVKAVQ